MNAPMEPLEITEYNVTKAALATLAQNYKSVVYQVATKEGMNSAKAARSEIKGYRINLEKMRKEIKEPALRRCQLIDDEARHITAELVALENPIDQQIKAEENRLEELRTAAIRAEQARIEAEALAKREAEEKVLAEQRADIARREAVLAQAEQARIAAEEESRRKIEEQERAARMKIENELRLARVAQEAEENRLREIRISEEDRLRAEQKAIEDKRRAEEQVASDKKREEDRLFNERLDGIGMLESFVKRFGHRDEFRDIAAYINELISDWSKQ